MKRLLLLISLVCIGRVNGHAQTNIYHPFPDSNGVWSQHFQYTSSMGYYLYSTFGDTTINSLKYNKVYRYAENSYNMSDTVITKNNSVLVGGMREDGFKKIWFYSFGALAPQDSIYKLYDFSKQIGDTIYFPQQFPNSAYAYQSLVIDSVDSILVNHLYRKLYYLNANGGPGYETWIEGIGSTRDLLSTITQYLMCTCIHETVCYKYYDTVYYMNPMFTKCYPFTNSGIENIKLTNTISVFPNPTNTYFIIETNTTDKQTADIYDLNGRHIFTKSVSDKDIINVTTLNEGVYTLTIKTFDRVINKKLVILR